MSSPPPAGDWRFRGRIAGWGTSEGTRLVLGVWHTSPLGAFADVMVERADGARLLLAPSPAVAELVGSTYRFDDVAIVPVTVRRRRRSTSLSRPVGSAPTTAGETWSLTAGPLTAVLGTGRRASVGWALQAVPDRVAAAPWFTWVTDPVARVVLPGVRTRGSAGAGRTEYYGAADVHRIATARSRWNGTDLGLLTGLHPPVRFGFGSAPRHPTITELVTTVRHRARRSSSSASDENADVPPAPAGAQDGVACRCRGGSGGSREERAADGRRGTAPPSGATAS